MQKLFPHLGLRTVKTALAVALALALAELCGSETPIFAAIGAISVMGRTLDDSLRDCLTQVFGTLVGFAVACAFVLALPDPNRWYVLGFGVFVVTALCARLRLFYAMSLACIVFADICMYGGDAFRPLYGFHRLTDTLLGLIVALAVNMAIKPYNNRRQIRQLLRHFLDSAPDLIAARALEGRYPDLAPLTAQVRRIEQELTIYEKQNFWRSDGHEEQAVFLRGCAQLADKLTLELQALCTMDETGCPNLKNLERLRQLGLSARGEIPHQGDARANAVCNYHLSNVLDAYGFLRDFCAMD